MSGKPASPASSDADPPSSGLWICVAVREEAAFLNRRAVPVLVTGMGIDNARRHLATRLRRERPEVLMTCGFAGALDPSLRVGTVVFDADDAFPWRAELLRAGARQARFLASERVVITAAEKQRLHAETGAEVVEMESSVLRQLCRAHGIPSATMRVVSDAAQEDLPVDFNRLMTSRMTLSFPRLALALLARPSRIGGLLALQRHTRLAARRLAEVLQPLVDQAAGEASQDEPG